MTTKNEIFTTIARQHLCIETLEQRNRDRLDFHDVAVWQIEKALRAAYEAGRDSTRRRRNRPKTTPRSKP